MPGVRASTITFLKTVLLDVRRPQGVAAERFRIEKGERVSGVPSAHVVQQDDEWIECFDLFLPSGDILLNIRYRLVTFHEGEP